MMMIKFVEAVQIVTYAPKWHLRFRTFCLTHIVDTYIVCSPLFKRGNQNFENFKKGREPEKKFRVGETKRERKDFQNERGDPAFQVEFRDKRGQRWGLSVTN